MPDVPLVIAHRGASAAQRENTVPAFRAAADLGADWVELDVRTTADGALVVHHDPVLGDGRVLAEVGAAALPGHVPHLAEALEVCAAGGLAVNVEIKALPGEPDEATAPALTDAVVALLGERWADRLERLLVTCFDPRTIDRVRERSGGALPTGLLAFDVADVGAVVGRAAEHGHAALNPWDPVTTEALVVAAHEAGLAVNVWTVDDPDRMAELVAMEVDGIITNVPDVARAVVDGPR